MSPHRHCASCGFTEERPGPGTPDTPDSLATLLAPFRAANCTPATKQAIKGAQRDIALATAALPAHAQAGFLFDLAALAVRDGLHLLAHHVSDLVKEVGVDVSATVQGQVHDLVVGMVREGADARVALHLVKVGARLVEVCVCEYVCVRMCVLGKGVLRSEGGRA